MLAETCLDNIKAATTTTVTPTQIFTSPTTPLHTQHCTTPHWPKSLSWITLMDPKVSKPKELQHTWVFFIWFWTIIQPWMWLLGLSPRCSAIETMWEEQWAVPSAPSGLSLAVIDISQEKLWEFWQETAGHSGRHQRIEALPWNKNLPEVTVYTSLRNPKRFMTKKKWTNNKIWRQRHHATVALRLNPYQEDSPPSHML